MPAIKRKPAPVTPRLALPKTFRLTDNERAVCARLVRVLREANYWIAPFIEWLLSTDASEVDRVGVSEVSKEIALHGCNNDLDWLKKFKAAHPCGLPQQCEQHSYHQRPSNVR